MTDLPRGSYPLVVPPPGGFEEAVKRGRRLRRRRAGASSGAALALAGVVAFATMGGPAGTSGLQPTDDDLPGAQRTEQAGSPAPSPSAEPSTTASPEPSASAGATSTAAPGYVPPTGAPQVDPTVPPTRPTDPPEHLAYARRSPIEESGPTVTANANTECPPGAGRVWCAQADAMAEMTTTGTRYQLTYQLCRAIDATGPGRVTFDRRTRANFAAKEKASNDTVWTYTAGQPVLPDSGYVDIQPGYCYEWTTYWNGQDDFGYTPPPGTYVLTGMSLGTSNESLPVDTYEFEVK